MQEEKFISLYKRLISYSVSKNLPDEKSILELADKAVTVLENESGNKTETEKLQQDNDKQIENYTSFSYRPKNSKGDDHVLPSNGITGWTITLVSKNCKDPEGAFKFLDYMCSEEAQIILNWGVEGLTYKYDESGKRVSLKNIPGNNGIGIWVYPFPQAGKGALDSKGDTICQVSEDKIRKSYYRVEKETLAAYGVNMWTELFPSPEELGQSRHGQIWQYSLSSNSQEIMSIVDSFVKQSLIRMILGPEKDFDRAWKEMTAGINLLGIDSVTSELNQLIDNKMELWYK